MMKTLFPRLGAALLVLCTVVLGIAPAAQAAPEPAHAAVSAAVSAPSRLDDPGAYAPTPTACTGSSSDGQYAASSKLLPVNRWDNATANMHSRLDNTFMADTAQLLQRHALISGGMTTGNAMWSLGTGMSSLAINFCILDAMGGAADGIGAAIGNAVVGNGTSSALLIGILLITVVTLLFRARRHGGAPWKTIAAKGALVGLLAVMVSGAMASTGGGKGEDKSQPYDHSAVNAPYHPGLMSPGWIVTTMNNMVSSLASAPASALVLANGSAGGYDTGNTLSCDNYIKSLHNGYQNTYGSGADKLSSGVPLILSTLWEGSGLQTWRTAQFGTSNLDGNTYCRLLDWNAGSPVMGTSVGADQLPGADTARATMGRINGALGTNESFYNSKAWQPTDTVSRDRSMVAWSACRLNNPSNPNSAGSWSVAAPFDSVPDHPVKNTDCKDWFNATGDVPGAFDWPSNGDDVQKRTTDLNLRDFIMTLHGNYNYHGMTAVIAYNLSAFAMLLVFGMIAVSIIVAKIFMVLMIIGAFILVIMSLLPSADMGRLAGSVKMLFGMNIFVFGIQLIFAMISILTKMLQDLGTSFLGIGGDNLVSTFWTGLSPLMAVYLLHMLFTKVMKVPSPFKLSAGLAWGASAAAVGGAAAAGMGAFLDRGAGRHGRKAFGMAKRAGGKGVNSVLSSATGGRFGKGSARRGAAAAAVGAAVGAELGAKGALAHGAAMPGDKGEGRRGKAALSGAFGNKAPGAVTADDLIESNVANSKVARGRMSGADRRNLAMAAKGEHDQALQWEKDTRAEMGLDPRLAGEAFTGLGGKIVRGTGAALDAASGAVGDAILDPKAAAGKAWGGLKGAGAAVGDGAVNLGRSAKTNYMEFKADPFGKSLGAATGAGRLVKKAAIAAKYSNAADQFRQKPLRTTAKAAALGAGLALTAPALAIPAVVAGGWMAAKGIKAVHDNTGSRKTAARDARTQAYREHMRLEKAQAAKEAKKAAKAEARAQAKTAGGPAQPVATGAGGQRDDALAPPRAAGPVSPATEPLPVTTA